MTVSHELFRLRINTNIVGYMKVHSNGIKDFSKDQFWWVNDPIEYEYKDQFSGLKDKDNRALFEYDIVAMRTAIGPKNKTPGIIRFDQTRQSFILIALETFQEYELFANELPLFHKTELTFLGFSFDEP